MSDDPALSLAQAARHPILPERKTPSTIYRWHRPGVKARNGERIRLEAERWGGRIYVRPSALKRFAERLAEADAAAPEPEDQPRISPQRQPAQSSHDKRERQIAEADERLARVGI